MSASPRRMKLLRPLPVSILATGGYRPPHYVTSEDLDRACRRSPGTTFSGTGVLERRWAAENETATEMAVHALRDGLRAAGVQVTDLDAVIGVCAVPEQPIPTNAVLILERLGHPGGQVEAFDVNASSLGFLTGLRSAAEAIAVGRWQYAGVAAAELASKTLDHSAVEPSGLIGDGAAAVVLGPVDDPLAIRSGPALLASRFETYPEGARLFEIRAGGSRFNIATPPPREQDYLIRSDSAKVLELASAHLPAFVEALLKDARWTKDDVDLVIPHQGGSAELSWIKDNLGFPKRSVVDVLATQGNQLSASLPSALHEAVVSGRMVRGSKVLLLGIGPGVSIGGLALRY